MNQPALATRKIEIALLIFIVVCGIFLRLPWGAFSTGGPLQPLESIHPTPAYTDVGFDEGLYRDYLRALIDGGLGAYPQIVEYYIQLQGTRDRSILPPLRFFYLFCGYEWHELFGSDPLDAIRDVSALASMLALLIATAFAWRLSGLSWAFGIAALMSVAPTQLHMSQHGFIDGFFGFLALLSLWLLWENLQKPRHWRWLAGYIISLVLLVLTKENAFFAWTAFIALIIASRWLDFGTVTRELLVATLIGPVVGLALLVLIAGGPGNLLSCYLLFTNKAPQYSYAILTGDGPWYRYLVDLLLVSPIVLILALGTLFRLDRTMKPECLMLIFIAASYLIMCNIKYGMNLRYANMWDMPIRFLAFGQIVALASLSKRYQTGIIIGTVVLLSAIEFHQYIVLAVDYRLYELITHHLLQALKILKTPY